MADERGAVEVRGPVIHRLGFTFARPDLKVPRMHPCQAGGVGLLRTTCGATPASLWERYCVNKHSRQVWLCPAHATLIAHGQGACTDCLDLGAEAVAMLRPVDLVLLGHIGSGGRG